MRIPVWTSYTTSTGFEITSTVVTSPSSTTSTLYDADAVAHMLSMSISASKYAVSLLTFFFIFSPLLLFVSFFPFRAAQSAERNGSHVQKRCNMPVRHSVYKAGVVT